MVAFTKSRADLESYISKSFDFQVDQRELFGPNGEATGFYGLFRSDTNEVISPSSVSDRYRPHQTSDVMRLFDAAWQAFDGVAEVDCYFSRGHYLTLSPSREQRLDIFGTIDNIFPRAIIRAGYDGKPFALELGWYRDLCKNLARPSAIAGTQARLRHTITLSDRIDAIVESFSKVRDSWTKVCESAKAMEAITVSVPEVVEASFGSPGESEVAKRHADELLDAITSRIIRERQTAGRAIASGRIATGWEAYNGIQGYVQHQARRNGSRTAFDRMLLAFDDPAVVAAEQHILALAS